MNTQNNQWRQWRSCASWSAGLNLGDHPNCPNLTTDLHDSEAEAYATCRELADSGYGGDKRVYPESVWVENVADDFEMLKEHWK